MKRALIGIYAIGWTLLACLPPAVAADLMITQDGKTSAVVAVAADAGDWEKRAAADLVHFIDLMSGAEPALADNDDAITRALAGQAPVLVVGQLALKLEPALRDEIHKHAKANPLLQSDAIVLRRVGNRVYLAGSNDESHYYAVVELLERWGCRWYLPTELGQCIPLEPTLKIETLDYAYGSPFEVRQYWLSWNGDSTGAREFQRRNRFNDAGVPNGHILGKYTASLAPAGKSMFNVPISDDATADHVAKQVLPIYAAGDDVQLGMEDGIYESDSPQDKELIALQYDKYTMSQSYTDAFLTFYNKVAQRLMKEAPQSDARIGFLAYSNITLPPVRVTKAEKPLVAYLAPIDIDPIHNMDDPRSAPRREYRDMLYKWTEVMDGRIVIYDYDQSMLVWRDLPNPSHQAFAGDVQHYRKANILGVSVESRGAMATTFTNLFLRGQLTWNPDADVDALLAEFYPKFYGPAAEPMSAYWGAIFKAWQDTIVTEHEYFVAPAIYTPELIAELKRHLAAAEAAIEPLKTRSDLNRNEKLYVERMDFTRGGFAILESYMAMVTAAAVEVDYAAAVSAGERGLAAREALTNLNETFTTYRRIGEHGYAWWPGEVQQYRELLQKTAGDQGALVAKLPLEWSFRRDPDDLGVKEQWQKGTEPEKWETLRTDLYAQAQGVLAEDNQSFTGHMWYSTEIDLDQSQVADDVHLMFPGIFNEVWLYVNGEQVGHRPFQGMWWLNDYRFEWDAPLAGKLRPGKNMITVRLYNPHHFGGMFRRPFLYRAKP